MTIGLFWGVWFGREMMLMSSRQCGAWDLSMRATAQQILLSLPRNVDKIGNDGYLKLPPQMSASNGIEEGNYQIWRRDGQLLLRSVSAPDEPWLPLRWDVDDSFGQSDANGEHWRVYAITDSSGQIQVQMGLSQRKLDAQSQAWLERSLWIAGSLMLLLGGVVWVVVRWSLRPLAQLGRALEARSTQNVQSVPTEQLPAEFVPLIAGFNSLLTRLQSALQTERRFIGDAAHELRTPLAALMTQAQLAHSAETLAQSRAALGPLIQGIHRSARLTEQLLDMARVDASTKSRAGKEPVALHELTAMVVHDFAGATQAAQQRLALHTEPCWTRADVDAVGVLLRNLLDNATRYSGAGSRIEVACRVGERDGAAHIALSVRDNGRGVPPTEHTRIIDRFYRVPGTVGNGSGIGLSLVSRIAELHGAALEVGEGLIGRGLGVTVWFAMALDPMSPAAALRSAPLDAG